MAQEYNDNYKEYVCDYFKKGFKYEEILLFLRNYHDLNISMPTLKRRVKAYGLKRRNTDYDIDLVRKEIRRLLDGPGCMGGNLSKLVS